MNDDSWILPTRIAELAERTPDAPAVTDVDGPSLTWRELHDQSLQWAAALRGAGVRTGETVVTMLPNSITAYLAWLGTAAAGAVEVPANNMYRGEMLRYLLCQSGARTAVISERYVDRLPADLSETDLRTVVIPDSDVTAQHGDVRMVTAAEFFSLRDVVDPPPPRPWDPAAIIFTSGTTGPSKGAVVPWQQMYQSPLIMPEGLLEAGRSYYSTYPSFHLSGKWALYNAASHEARLVIRESFSASEFWNDIRRFDVRGTPILGTIAALLMAQPPRSDDADNPLERVMMGPIIADIDEFKERFGVKHVATAYGMTEVGFPIVSGWDPPNPRTCGRLRAGSPGFELRLADEHDRPVPVGEVGELIVRADDPWVITTEYWRMPEQTAAAWRNGWFHTGDGFVEDEQGWLYFVDRRKDALRRRGENISSFEVEASILQHPAVAEVAVVGVPSDFEDDDVMAVVVRKPETLVTPVELLDFLVPRMPSFMVPRYIEFTEALPKTEATLRVRKVELRAAGVSERTWDREAVGYRMPR